MERTFICSKCDKGFTRKCNLIRHIRVCNSRVINNIKNHIICPLCSERFFRSSSLDEHLEKKHEINITCEEIVFSSEDDFHKWKEEVEKSSLSLYRKASVNNKATVMIYFRCHRSGFSSSTSKRKRRATNKGSCKIDGYCPSRIIVRKLPDRTIIRYYPIHVGHDKEVRFLHLSKTLEEIIAHKLKEGKSLDHILNKRDEFLPISNPQEKQLINRKKLHNILQKYHIPYIGNYSINRIKNKANSSINENKLIEHNQERSEDDVSDLRIEEAMVVGTNSSMIENERGKHEIYLRSTNHYDSQVALSYSYTREEICITSNESSDRVPEFNFRISDKLRHVCHLFDTTDLKQLNDEERSKISSNIDEIVEILSNSCSR